MLGERRTIVLGFLAALLVLGALVWFVGVGDVLGAIAAARTDVLALVLVLAAVWLVCFGLSLWVVLDSMGYGVSARTAVLVYAAAIFANNITPFGQAGGEPFSAMMISDVADTEYENGLAAIASVDTVHFVPTTIYATIGFVYVAAGTVQIGQDIVVGGAILAALVVVLPVAGYLGWRNRDRLEAFIARALVAVTTPIARVLPNRSPVTYGETKRRVEGFFAGIERIATDRRTIAFALGFSALGWLAQIAVLWLSLYAVGATVPPEVVFLVLPISMMASMTPLPGGSGAVESVLAALLAATGTVSLTLATSGALLFRGAIYWLPTLVGGTVASLLGADRVS